MKIYLDAGHRNSVFDYGATSGTVKESVLALQITNKLKSRLTTLGHTVYTSRLSEDDVISLADRVSKANGYSVDLYLSIHINSATNSEANGVECLHYQGDTEAKKSQSICSEICKLTGQRNRGAKVRNDLYVLSRTKMQALLVECGFICNPTEVKQLQDSSFQDLIVEGILKGLDLQKEGESMANVKIKLSDIDRIETVVVDARMTASQVYEKYKPDYMINGVLFDMSTGGILTNIKANSKKYGYMFCTEGICVKWSKTLSWCNKETALGSNEVTQWIAGAPTLVKDGEKHIDLTDCKTSFANASAIRTAIGFNDNELLLVATDSNYTFSGLADWMLNQGCKYAVSTDGGGSTVLMKDGVALNKGYSGRLIPHWILVYTKKTQAEEVVTVTPKPTEVYFENSKLDGLIIDGSTYCPVRKLAEALGLKVDFVDGKVYIKK